MFFALWAYSSVLNVSCEITDVTLGQAEKLTHVFVSLAKYIIYFRYRLSDFKFTSRFTDAGEIVAIIDVFVRPPRES